MLFHPSITIHIAQSMYWADRQIRSELISGLIAGENDYTSNLTATIRRQINSKAIPNLFATSFVLKAQAERKTGTDACIILANNSSFKVCIFEAKHPRLTTNINSWDSIQKSSGNSHFHDQLHRQHKYNSDFAIFEIFYSEAPYFKQNSQMQNYTSTCVGHAPAFLASNARGGTTKWTDVDLLSLLGTNGKNIFQIATEICECKIGKPFSTSDYFSVFSDNDNAYSPSEVLLIKFDGTNEMAYETSHPNYYT